MTAMRQVTHELPDRMPPRIRLGPCGRRRYAVQGFEHGRSVPRWPAIHLIELRDDRIARRLVGTSHFSESAASDRLAGEVFGRHGMAFVERPHIRDETPDLIVGDAAAPRRH